jgi:DNA polymerase III delta prime subunit
LVLIGVPLWYIIATPTVTPPPILSIRNSADISIDVHDTQEGEALNDPLYCVTNGAVKVVDATFSITSDHVLPVGMTFDETTGVFSETYTHEQAGQVYTIDISAYSESLDLTAEIVQIKIIFLDELMDLILDAPESHDVRDVYNMVPYDERFNDIANAL